MNTSKEVLKRGVVRPVVVILIIATVLFLLLNYAGKIERAQQKRLESQTEVLACRLLSRDIDKDKIGTLAEQNAFITTFDCGKEGIILTHNKSIFRKAKDQNKLKVYFTKDDRDYRVLSLLAK